MSDYPGSFQTIAGGDNIYAGNGLAFASDKEFAGTFQVWASGETAYAGRPDTFAAVYLPPKNFNGFISNAIEPGEIQQRALFLPRQLANQVNQFTINVRSLGIHRFAAMLTNVHSIGYRRGDGLAKLIATFLGSPNVFLEVDGNPKLHTTIAGNPHQIILISNRVSARVGGDPQIILKLAGNPALAIKMHGNLPGPNA